MALTIAVIAGETSGDQLGGWLMAALKRQQPTIEFIGLGGPRMQEQGLKSLFDMQEIALMGMAEVIPHYVSIKRRIREMVAYLEAEKPDIVVTVDSRGFTYRVVAALRKRGRHRPTFYHYVAPSVWVYRPGRVHTAAKLFDALFCLLPFEPPYFEPVGLPAHFIGHEVAWYWRDKGDGAAFRLRHNIAPETPLLALFPGSRRSELKKLLPTLREAIMQLKQSLPSLELLVMVPPHLQPRLRDALFEWNITAHLVSNTEEKKDVFASATAALAKSGTIALECALAGLPSVTTYKVNPLTAAILRRIVKTPFFNLANILSRRMVIPELIQENATPENICNALLPLLTGGEARDAQLEALRDVATQLGAADDQSPSDKAATIILRDVKATA